jgi:TPR repeat protein
MAANQGNAEAQYNLGIFYRDGIGMEEDDKQARRFFEMSANQINSDARVALARLNLEGGDYEQAIQHVEVAANQGNANAQVALGLFFSFGARRVQYGKKPLRSSGATRSSQSSLYCWFVL